MMPDAPAARPREVTLRYFAWVREKIGRSEEHVALPADVVTVADLIAWMPMRGAEFAAAFADPRSIRVALDRVHAKKDATIGAAKEIAFFPPVTGG